MDVKKKEHENCIVYNFTQKYTYSIKKHEDELNKIW